MKQLNKECIRFGKRSFTLIELLIVIGIITIVSVVVLLILNPAVLFEQSRDGGRLSELTSLEKAVSIFQAESGGLGGAVPYTLYISLPDPTLSQGVRGDCSGLTLPPLPGPAQGEPQQWVYNCVSEDDLLSADGTGWLPIDFTLVKGASFSVLPVDTKNHYDASNFVNNFFYAFAIDDQGNFEITSKTESTKYGLGG